MATAVTAGWVTAVESQQAGRLLASAQAGREPGEAGRFLGRVGLAVVDLQLRIVAVSPSAAEILACAEGDLIGSQLPGHFSSPAEVVEAARAVTGKQRPVDHQLELRVAAAPQRAPTAESADREPPPRTVLLDLLSLGDDALPRLIAVIKEPVSPAELAAALIRRGHFGLGRSEVSLVPQLMTDTNGIITAVNHSMQVLLGLGDGRLVGTALGDYFADPARIAAGLATALHSGEATDFELALPRPNGTEALVSYRAWPVRGRGGALESIVVTMYDLAERRRGAPAWGGDAVDVAQAEFTSRVSHELRSRLTSMLGFLELLADEGAGPLNEEQQKMVAIVDRSSRQLSGLIEDVLTVAQIEGGALQLTMRQVDFSELVRDVCAAYAPQMRSRNLGQTVTAEPGLAMTGDSAQLTRLVDNLLSNAVKFSLIGGRVDVFARRDPDTGEVVLTVTDTGIGIPAQEQERVFSKFFQSSLSRRAETKGLGLGLYQVKEIVARHHGSVDAMSMPGEGTTVVVRLPANQAATEASTE